MPATGLAGGRGPVAPPLCCWVNEPLTWTGGRADVLEPADCSGWSRDDELKEDFTSSTSILVELTFPKLFPGLSGSASEMALTYANGQGSEDIGLGSPNLNVPSKPLQTHPSHLQGHPQRSWNQACEQQRQWRASVLATWPKAQLVAQGDVPPAPDLLLDFGKHGRSRAALGLAKACNHR
jgi:hypothetical protein